LKYDDATHQVKEVKDGDGNLTTLVPDATGTQVTITSPYQQGTILTIGPDGYLASITNPANETVSFTYWPGGLLKTRTEPGGDVHMFDYDDQGLLKTDTNNNQEVKSLTRTQLDHGYMVDVMTKMQRETKYSVEYLPNEGERRVISCCGGGLQTELIGSPNGTSTIHFPDGTTAVQTLGPDPRWGMQAPLITQLLVTTPGGRTTTITAEHKAVLADPENPLSLT
jgi:YD repeat-containing protein